MSVVPFNCPAIVGREFEYLRSALESRHISGDGVWTKRAHRILEELTGAGKALLTTSCTHALEMCALLLDVGPDDEVVVPAFTFVSTANAFALRGARIVFADIRPDTLNLDERLLPSRLSPRTKAVLVVHYAGVACDMDAIVPEASARGVSVVEDAAHALFATWRGRPLGSFGRLATLSFHETKNVTCGEGGALLLNDPALAARAEILREKGTDRSRFFRGEVDKYTWVDLGSSWLPSDLLAAYLVAQLEERDAIQGRRQAIWSRYAEEVGPWAAKAGFSVPTVPEGAGQPAHLFYLLAPDAATRARLLRHLAERGIDAVSHYQPLHLSTMGRRFGGRPGDCPVAESVSERLVRLPLHASLDAVSQARVVAAVRSF